MFGKCGVDFEKLVDFALGQLEGEESARMKAHLEGGCARCQREIGWLRQVVATMQADESVEPPLAAMHRAVHLFARRFPAPARTASLIPRIAARLVFDSRLAMPVAGVRYAGLAARQLLYSAPDLDIDLHIERGEREAEFTLMGQVLPTAGDLGAVAGAEVQLLHGNRKVLSKSADALGEFVFGRLPAGKYALRIRARGQEVDLVGIDI